MRIAFTAMLVALLGLLASPAPAAAHAALLSTTPDNWRLLDSSPAAVSMRFTEPVDLGLAQIRLVGPRGNDIAGIGRPEHPAGSRNTIAVTVPETLANGTYTVAWRVVSADTHPVQGAFTFSVREITGVAPVGSSAENGLLTSLYHVSRWLGLAGFALLVGTAFMIAVCWPGAARRRAARRLLSIGLVTTVVTTMSSLLLYGPYAGGLGLGPTISSRIGLILELRLLLLMLAALAAFRLLRREPAEDPSARRGIMVLAGAGTLAATWSLVTHGAAGQLAPLSVPVDLVHLTAMGVWIGGLPLLLGVLLRSGDIAAMRAAIPRFSRIAGVCVAALVATGLYQSWRQVGTLAALFGTTYGFWLLGKLALVAVLLAIGAFARLWVRRHYGLEPVGVSGKRRVRRGPEPSEVRRFRRLVAAEVVLAGLLLGVTASLGGTEPARAELDRERNPPVASSADGPVTLAVPFDAGGGPAGRGQVALVFTPAKVGPNELHIAVLDRAGAAKQVPELRAELRLARASIGPIPVPLASGGAGHYLASEVNLPMAGQWELALTVRTSEIDQTTVRIPVNAR